MTSGQGGDRLGGPGLTVPLALTAGVRDPVILVTGVVGVVGNVLAVVLLKDIPGAYRLAQLDGWARGVLAHPEAASASAAAFTVGLFALAAWAIALTARLTSPGARAGLWLIAIGSVANGIGTLTPLVLAMHVGDGGPDGMPLARALLGTTLTLDAAFNATLGVGLVLVGAGWRGAPRWIRGLAIGAGVASIPVAAQAVYDRASDLLLLAGPLWLGFVLVTAFRRWGDARR